MTEKNITYITVHQNLKYMDHFTCKKKNAALHKNDKYLHFHVKPFETLHSEILLTSILFYYLTKQDILNEILPV